MLWLTGIPDLFMDQTSSPNINVRPAKASISRESSFNLFTTEDYVKVSHPNYKSQVIDVKKQKSVRLEPLLFLDLNKIKLFMLMTSQYIFKPYLKQCL